MNEKLTKMLTEVAEANGYSCVNDLLRDYNWEISVRPHKHERAELLSLLIKYNHTKNKRQKKTH